MPTMTAPASEETRAAPMMSRDLSIRPNSYDAENHTVEVRWSTGARGARFLWDRWAWVDEELSLDAASVRLDRMNAGGPVLNTHRRYELENQIGVVVPGSARVEDGLGIATVRFSQRESVQPIEADVAAGVIRNLSVGYVVHTYEVTEREGQRPLYRAVDWEPMEISFVPIPFDAGSQVRSGEPAQEGNPCIIRRNSPATQEGTESMPTAVEQPAGETPATEVRAVETPAAPAAPAAPVERAADPQPITVDGAAVRRAASNAGLSPEVTMDLLARHADERFTQTTLFAEIGRRFAERDAPATTVSRAPAQPGNGVTMSRAMGDALVHRMVPGSELSEDGRNFRGMSMLRMAEELLASTGVNVRGMPASEIAERSLHSSSDFPSLVGGALNRRLRDAYQANHPSYQRWARRAPNAPDFKAIDVVQTSAMPELLRVNEGGEIKYGTIKDGKISYSVLTYGRVIGFTRQMIINDDLRALDRITSGYAVSASRLENRTVYGILTANAAFPDGKALFHADHGNLAATGAVIDAATLAASRTRMRLQKGLQEEELNLSPSYLIVPATQEQRAYQFTSSMYVPAKQADVNEFRQGGRTALEPIVESLLDGVSTTAWYTAASNNSVDTVEYAYLDGAEGVQLSSRIGFTVDGVEFKAMLDFAAAAIDWRGLDKNPGA